jgi:predicted enzyme related to lactoylglutathione lyase
MKDDSYSHHGGLNHVAIVVDDLDATEERIRKSGCQTFNHADYEPGRRFYLKDDDGIEFEIVSYAQEAD